MNTKDNETRTTENVTISRAEYENLQAQLAEMKQQNDWLMQQLRLSKKKIFGASSEKSKPQAEGQMSLFFNEAEALAYGTVSATAEQKAEKEKIRVRCYSREKSGSARDVVPEGVRVEVVEHRLEEQDRICPTCGKIMTEIGKEVRESLVTIPAQIYIRQDVYYTYACKSCDKEGTETQIRKTPHLASVIPGSYTSPEMIAYIMTQKFVMGSPLYRMEKEWGRQGYKISRQSMSNWILKAAEDWLSPVYECMHKQLLAREVLHADETTLQVLKEPGKKAQSKSYMWLYRTSGDAEHPIVLYEYQPDRKAEHPQKFLKGFKGYLHADGYAGYHKLNPDITVVGCMAHLRRKFDEAVKALPNKEQKNCAALTGQAYCSKLFKIEESLQDLTPEERCKKRLELEKPVLDAMLSWAESQSAAPKSALGKAIHYLRKQWPYLVNYLKDGRCELSNNRAERSIKPFVIDRKNFLFANTPGGARGSSVMFSLIETAKENGLDPYRYLSYIFTTAPQICGSDPDWAERMLPENVPDTCRVPD